jgi:pyruvate dehydrogenase E2 component (dihydrolipoamide acetyltransferase)
MVLAADIGHSAATSSAPVAAPAAADTIQEIPLTGIRKIIADRMRQSLASTAQLTLTRSFDATAILDYRRQIKDEGQTFGLPNITINDMIAFATARTLRRHSTLNGHVADGRITRHSAVHLGVATDTPRGLMVPVLRNAHALTLPDFSRQLKPLLEAAQSGTINPDLLRGGTFTITNMGMLGVETFTPILNAPEVAILGIGGLVWKPVEQNGAIRHVQSITLSLTIDHQAVDGAPGARFLQDLANALQNFALTLTASA